MPMCDWSSDVCSSDLLPPLCALCDADKRHFHSWAAPHPLEDGMCQGRVQHPQMCPWQQSIHLLMTQDNLIKKWTRSYSSLGLPLFIPSAFWPVKDRALQRPCWRSLGNGLSADAEATTAPAREFPGGPVVTEVPDSTQDEALFHYTKNSGGPRGPSQIHSIATSQRHP